MAHTKKYNISHISEMFKCVNFLIGDEDEVIYKPIKWDLVSNYDEIIYKEIKEDSTYRISLSNFFIIEKSYEISNKHRDDILKRINKTDNGVLSYVIQYIVFVHSINIGSLIVPDYKSDHKFINPNCKFKGNEPASMEEINALEKYFLYNDYYKLLDLIKRKKQFIYFDPSKNREIKIDEVLL